MAARPASSSLPALQPLDGGAACTLAIRAQPGAKRNGPAGFWNGMLKLAVTAPADKGRANAALALELAAVLELKPALVELVSGAHARTKRFRIAQRFEIVALRLAQLASEAHER
jgi:uncharacterized protein